MAVKKRGLGKGLGALLNTANINVDEAVITMGAEINDKDHLKILPTNVLHVGKYQPRREINKEALQELADSIKAQGIIQPIIVRPLNDKKYEIIAGERRWRAAQLAGLTEVPVVIKNISDEATIAMALIENIQREDLNPMEEAVALQRLMDEFALTQQQVADAVGKSRASVTNYLRLLALPQEVRTFVAHGDIEMGHAKVLLALDELGQLQAANIVVNKGLSVRETENLVKRMKQGATEAKPTSHPDPDVVRLQQRLSDKLGAKVSVNHTNKGKGKLVIHYNSLDELDGILEKF